jgi:hypothetical protein
LVVFWATSCLAGWLDVAGAWAVTGAGVVSAANTIGAAAVKAKADRAATANNLDMIEILPGFFSDAAVNSICVTRNIVVYSVLRQLQMVNPAAMTSNERRINLKIGAVRKQ